MGTVKQRPAGSGGPSLCTQPPTGPAGCNGRPAVFTGDFQHFPVSDHPILSVLTAPLPTDIDVHYRTPAWWARTRELGKPGAPRRDSARSRVCRAQGQDCLPTGLSYCIEGSGQHGTTVLQGFK